MNQTTTYIIGIDTGGTFTDAVAMERATRRIVAAAKRPTTHHDLSLGVGAAVRAVLDKGNIPHASIDAVAISTTLATNSVVEGRGARVALFLIGYDKNLRLPVVAVKHIQGGHKFSGEEDKPLALENLLESVRDCQPHVDAYAVCAAMSFVNPAHELVAAKAIGLLDPKPVFCSHRASGLPGVEERAATAVLNARLMPVMQSFLAEVAKALGAASVTAPVRVVRGDLAVMDAAAAMENPAFTFASGPAASARYGAAVAATSSDGAALVVDVGGTTTDVVFVRNGAPTLKEGGNFIGEWETHVRTVAMHTAGVGGDSWVRPVPGGFMVGPTRVAPLAMADAAPEPAVWLDADPGAKCIFLAPGVATDAATVGAEPLLVLLRERGPSTAASLMTALRVGEIGLQSRLDAVLRRNLVVEAGFTVTDALHVLGAVDFGDAARSSAGAALLAQAYGLGVEEFCRDVVLRAQDKIEDTILRQCLFAEVGHGMAGLLDARRSFSMLEVQFALNSPLVGLGAAAAALLPAVAARLRTTLVLPPHYEVGNAAGAALSAADALMKQQS